MTKEESKAAVKEVADKLTAWTVLDIANEAVAEGKFTAEEMADYIQNKLLRGLNFVTRVQIETEKTNVHPDVD